jgi:hypothetical protein
VRVLNRLRRATLIGLAFVALVIRTHHTPEPHPYEWGTDLGRGVMEAIHCTPNLPCWDNGSDR